MTAPTTYESKLPRSRFLAVVAVCAAAIGLPVLAAASPAVATTGQHQGARPATSLAANFGHHDLARTALSDRAALRARSALLGQSASITGIVRGADGLPLTGACVSAIGSRRSVTTGTAPDGTFDITGLAPGSYQLEYRDCSAPVRFLSEWSGGTAWQRSAAPVLVLPYQVKHVPVMTLRPVNPAALLPDPARWRRLVTTARRLHSAAAAASAGKITGVVTGDGKPLRGICVVVDGEYGAMTGKHGRYAIGGLWPGRYYVSFEPQFDCADKANWLQQNYRGRNTLLGPPPGNLVKVAKGKTTRGIDGNLVRGGQISGTVTGPAGKRLRGICVEVWINIFGEGFGYEAATARNGTYELHALFPGHYSVSVFTGCGNNGNYTPAFPHAVRIRHATHRTVDV
jgi:hypothetical protein